MLSMSLKKVGIDEANRLLDLFPKSAKFCQTLSANYCLKTVLW